MEKSLARKTGRARRSLISEEDRIRYDRILLEMMKERALHAGMIGCYVSVRDEADTHAFLKWCFASGRKTAVPLVKDGTLEFHEITSFSSLKEGTFGVMEPYEGRVVSPRELDLMFVPLSAFDKNGNRTGYGKGYYDSVLLPSMHKAGVAYPEQRVDHIDADPWDIRLDEVLVPEI